MSKHTPPPWKAHFEEAYFVTGPDLGRVATMMNLKGAHGMGGRRSGDESAANCRLIAAAPDMAEALQLVMAWIDAWQPEFTQDPEWEEAERKAHAALVKAGRE